ncbi:MAG: PepSY-like domain-containing protein [Saprospiraceae bacterium]
MKKFLFLFAIAGSSLIISCNKEDLFSEGADSALQIDYSSDPTYRLISDEMLAATDQDAESRFEFTSNTALSRGPGDKGGKRKNKIGHPCGIKGDSIGFADLPGVIQTYLNTNLGGVDSIKAILKITMPDSSVQYSVRFLNGTHIHFDAAGNVLTGPKDHFTAVKFEDLPAAVQTYLNANFDVSTILQITKRKSRSGEIVYEVRFANNTRIALDENGNVLVKPTDTRVVLTYAELPDVVKTFLEANTTVANIVEISKFIRPDGKVLFDIRFSNGKHLTLDADAKVVRGKKRK